MIRPPCLLQIRDQRAAPPGCERSCPSYGLYRSPREPKRDGAYPLMAPRVIQAEMRAAAPAGGPAQGTAWPVRAGAVPPLAAAFTVRTDSVPRIEALLEPGGAVALVPVPEGAGDAAGWLRACGKTQLAVYLAEALWQSRGVELLAWVNASDRASVLSGYTEAAALLGLDDGGDAELVAARFLGWLGSTARPWLVVLDDVRDAADLDGLLPGGPAGRLLITAADAEVVPGPRQVTVPAFSQREAMAYLFDRLAANQDQRNGAYDLAEDLRGEPAALAQAAAVMAGSGTGCRAYQRYFTEQRERLRAADGREPPAAAVTWMLSADYAEELLPGGGTWPLLVLAALLDSHGIPVPVLTGPAACRYLAGTGARSPDPQHAQSACWPWNTPGSSAPARPCYVGRALQRAARATAPAELLGQAVRAAADAVLEAWPQDQPRSGAGRADAGVRGEPAAPRRRRAVGRRQLPPGAAGRRAEPGRRPAHRPGGRLVAGGGRPLRPAARPRPSRHAGRGRAAGRRAAGRRAARRRRALRAVGPRTAGTGYSAPATRPPSPPGSASAGRWPASGEAQRGAPGPAGAPPRAASGPTATATRKPWPCWTSTPPRSSRPATPPPRCASASGRWPAASRRTARLTPRRWPPRSGWPPPAWPAARPKTRSASTSASWPPASRPSAPTTPDTLERTGQPGRRLRHGRADRRRAARAPAGLRRLRARARPRPPPHPGPPRGPGPRLLRGRAARRRRHRAARQHQPAPSRPCPRATRSPAGCGRYRTASPRTLAAE